MFQTFDWVGLASWLGTRFSTAPLQWSNTSTFRGNAFIGSSKLWILDMHHNRGELREMTRSSQAVEVPRSLEAHRLFSSVALAFGEMTSAAP